MNIYLLAAGALVLHFAVLSIGVSVLRVKDKRMFGSTAELGSLLYRAVRAQGNAAEYLTVFIPFLIYLATVPQALIAPWFPMLLVGARVVHSVGLLLSTVQAKPHVLRAIGGAVTFYCLVKIGIVLVRVAMGW